MQAALEAALDEDHRPARSARWPAAGPTPASTPWARSSASGPRRRLAADVLLRALNAELPRRRRRARRGRSRPTASIPIRDAVRQALSLRDPRRPGPRRVSPRATAGTIARRLDAEAMHRAAAGAAGHARFQQLRDQPARRAETASARSARSSVRREGRAGGPTISSSSKSRPTGSSTTWSARSSARWSKWDAARRTKPGSAEGPGRRRPPRRRPHRAAARAVSGGRGVS